MLSKILKKLGLEHADVLPLLFNIGGYTTILLMVLRVVGITDMSWEWVFTPFVSMLVLIVILILRELGVFRR